MRIGVFGGSFDPVHVGHLWIAESAIETLRLDQLRWLPASTSPLKPKGSVASDKSRLEMVRLAVAGADGHVVDDRELRRGGTSYTIDTVEELQREFPDDELFLVIGSDSLAGMRQWHRPEELLQMVTLAVVQRGGEPEINFGILEGIVDQDRIDKMRRSVIPMPIIEVSSRAIRQRVRTHRSIRFRVPHAVQALIKNEQLYGGEDGGGVTGTGVE
ncbi:MAG: nicotinate-nucleotide adenylyltransferase [Planctomycetota bacterium]